MFRTTAIALALGLVFGTAQAWAKKLPKVIYVQAVKTELKAEPKMNGKKVIDLKRGDQLNVKSKKGIWYQVEASGKSGWISRLFISKKEPIGHAELASNVKGSLAKASRRRSSSYAVSASTRGLTASNRIRTNREEFSANFLELKAIEEYSLSDTELGNFQRNGKLTTY